MASSTIPGCPSCSRILRFATDTTHFIVCSNCKKVIYRDPNGALQAISDNTVDNASVIQPGTTGSWKDKRFTVLGRFRCWFDESVFSYWTLQTDKDEILLLAESYGLYMIMTQMQAPPLLNPSDFARISPGNILEWEHRKRFLLEKKQVCNRFEIEGEAFLPAGQSAFTVLDFAQSKTRQRVSFFEVDEYNITSFEVEPVSFQQLKLQQLRDYENPGKEFTCTSCKTTIHVKTYPFAQSCACPSCGAFYAIGKNGAFTRGKTSSAGSIKKPWIVNGSKGRIHDIDYEVIGYIQKEEQNAYHSRWHEYTLFNPTEGFAFLSEYDGHWIYLREKVDCPVVVNPNETYFIFDGRGFDVYNSYAYKIKDGSGEYPYNTFDNELAKAREFISPPFVWTREWDRKEGIKSFHGEHISQKDLKEAFGIKELPLKVGIGAVQPTVNVNTGTIFLSLLGAVLLLLLVHAGINSQKQERQLFNQVYTFSDTTNQFAAVTEKFTLDKWRSNIRFDIYAYVDNSWFEAGITLVNATTGKEYHLEKGVEYYHGISEGEAWTEGSRNEVAYFTRVPAGTYFMQIEGARSDTLDKIREFTVKATYDVATNRNIYFSIALLLLWPVITYFRTKYNEQRRWSNSPFSNYEPDES